MASTLVWQFGDQDCELNHSFVCPSIRLSVSRHTHVHIHVYASGVVACICLVSMTDYTCTCLVPCCACQIFPLYGVHVVQYFA